MLEKLNLSNFKLQEDADIKETFAHINQDAYIIINNNLSKIIDNIRNIINIDQNCTENDDNCEECNDMDNYLCKNCLNGFHLKKMKCIPDKSYPTDETSVPITIVSNPSSHHKDNNHII